MKYMFLMYTDESHEMTEEQAARAREIQWGIMRDTTKQGIFRAASPLYPTSTAVSVRYAKGTVSMTDGPFAETKEALGGFYMLDCRNMDEAKYWAGRMSSAGCASTVEIRQVADIPGVEDVEPSLADAVHA
jgi:hypothetical protein